MLMSFLTWWGRRSSPGPLPFNSFWADVLRRRFILLGLLSTDEIRLSFFFFFLPPPPQDFEEKLGSGISIALDIFPNSRTRYTNCPLLPAFY
ncbi:unnamed protein product [Linum trigynum]|uniref:Uncharacterized protein n=1 Tax=Linum trigynum TaxID=586398 RepID=A0AAV2G3U0_9ROSI